MAVAVSDDFSRCTCKSEMTFPQFEKQEYNKILKEKQSYIKELEAEIDRLNKFIKQQFKKP